MSIIFLRFYFSFNLYYFSNYLELTQFDLILFIYSFWLPIITLVNKRKLIFFKEFNSLKLYFVKISSKLHYCVAKSLLFPFKSCHVSDRIE